MVKVTQNGKYNNIQLKTFKGQPGLGENESVVVTKGQFPDAKAIPKTNAQGQAYTLYMCSAVYEGQNVSFALFDGAEAAAWNDAGGVGDDVKITLVEEKYINKKGAKAIKEKLIFEKVQ